ncbi:MAG: phosphatase PAP2 family protein [Dehalococcoidia bacterium]
MLRVLTPAPTRLEAPRRVVAGARIALRSDRRNTLHGASWALALGFELAMLYVLWGGHIYGWEQSVTRTFQDVPGHWGIYVVSSTLTNTISIPFGLLFVAILGFVFSRGERTGATLLLLSFPLHVLSQFPKFFFERPRPSSDFDGISGIGGLNSFPSGHSEYVITFYGFLAYLLILRLPGRAQKIAVGAGFVAFALTTGFGRIAGGRHWPMDVLTSYVIGLGLLSGLIWIHTAWQRASVVEAAEVEPIGFPAPARAVAKAA